MNILDAMEHLTKHPYGDGSIFRTSWVSSFESAFVYLIGYLPLDARSLQRPECYRVTIRNDGVYRSWPRPYVFDYSDIVATDWEIFGKGAVE